MKDFLIAFTTIFIAEIGDKTMLAVVFLARNFGLVPVIIGTFLGTAMIMLLPVAVGMSLNYLTNTGFTCFAGGFIFVATGMFFIYSAIKGGEEEESVSGRFLKMSPMLAVAITIFFMEFGDKTQILALGVTSKLGGSLFVWAGLTLGMFTADISSLLFLPLLQKIPERIFKGFSGFFFVILGVLLFLQCG